MCLILFLVREKFPTCTELCHKVIKQETTRAEFLCEPNLKLFFDQMKCVYFDLLQDIMFDFVEPRMCDG